MSEQLVALEGEVKKREEEARESAGVAESRKAEIEETVEKLAQKELQVQELNERLAVLEGQVMIHEEEARQASGIAESRKVEIDETVHKLAHKEAEVNELNEKLIAFEGHLKMHEEVAREASSIAESRKAEIEVLQDTVDKLAQKELVISELNERINALEGQVKAQQEEAFEASAIAESRKAEIEEMVNKLSQKELEVDKLNERLASLQGQLKTYQEEALETSQMAESRKLEIEQLQGAFSKLAEKELEVKELVERINVLGTQIKIHQEAASESSRIVESKKHENEEVLQKYKVRKKRMRIVLKSGQVDMHNDALAKANMKLFQDLASTESTIGEGGYFLAHHHHQCNPEWCCQWGLD